MARDAGHAYAKDERPSDVLVELYLSGPETDDGRQALAILHYRGGDA